MAEQIVGPSGFPAARIEALRIYEPAHDRFFDALVEFFAAFAGVFYGLKAQQEGSVKAFGPNQGAIMLGTQASGVGFTFFPFFIFEPLLRNAWPTEVRLAEFPLAKVPGSQGPDISSVARINAGLLEASFVRYFESQRETVVEKFGPSTASWPEEWNFARVLRNAFAHGGKIHFTNANAPPVKWRNLTYSPADNGRTITFVDVSPVELILLLEDIDHDL